MSIENLLTKIIANYKKKKLSLTIKPDCSLQSTSGSQEVSPINSVKSSLVYSPQVEHLKSECKNSDLFTPISTKEELSISDINIIEWREYRRKNISIPIDFANGNRFYKEMTKNISAGGLFIETQKYNTLTKNQTIMMVFTIIENQKPFKLTGKIIRVQSEGIAVQFHNISQFDCVAIEETLGNLFQ